MKIRVIKVGKPAVKEYERLIERYYERLRSAYRLENVILKNTDTPGILQRLEINQSGGKSGRVLVSLDERGKSLSSTEFSDFLRQSRDGGEIKSLDFIIGPPYGLPIEVRDQSQQIWRLSEMIFPSDLAWLILWEQLYRAHTMITGSKYHHD